MVDKITREVLRHKFDAIADEMETSLLQSAYSSIVKEAQDASAAIFDTNGRTIAQAVAIPAHLGMLIPAVETIIETHPPGEMKPDDVYLMNDPYNGGTHLPDITIVKPIFNDDQVIALATSMAHHQEMGGKTPGSIPTDATEIYQEGLRFPPLKLYDQGDENETFISILKMNVRIPNIVIGDLNAQVSACKTAERRVEQVASEFGNSTFSAAVDQLMDHAEERTRSHIEDIPDGNYSFHDFIDDDGIDHHSPIRIEATVEVNGSDLHFDFTGTDDQVTGPVNSVPSATMSAVYYVVRAITDPDIPNNAGCFVPVSMDLPEGSLVNPNPPAPVNARTVTFKRIANVLLGAFAQAIPEQVPAAGNGQLAALTFAGNNDDAAWIYGETGAGGDGARPTKDGLDCLETDVTNCMNTPAEATEMEYPIRVWKYNLWEDSGGSGRYRGGLGTHKQFEILDDDVTLTHRRDRHDFQPWGLDGGNAAPTCETIIRHNDGNEESIPSKVIASLDIHDIVDVYTTGGGGYGPPTERPIEKVAQDVQDEKVSPAVAELEYGVAIDDDGTVNEAATSEQRGPQRMSQEKFLVDRGELPQSVEQ